MAFNYAALRGKIIEKYGSQREFAKVLGFSEVSVTKKMNGKTEFSKSDMERWAELLDIKKSEIPKYFFA